MLNEIRFFFSDQMLFALKVFFLQLQFKANVYIDLVVIRTHVQSLFKALQVSQFLHFIWLPSHVHPPTAEI